MPKTVTLGVLNKRPPAKTEFHQADEDISRETRDEPRDRALDCWYCIDGIIVGETITDPDQVVIYGTIDDFVVQPTGTNTSVAIGAQATRSTARLYLLPTNARYVRTVSVDFLYVDLSGWTFIPPRTIEFTSDLIESSYVWVRYVA